MLVIFLTMLVLSTFSNHLYSSFVRSWYSDNKSPRLPEFIQRISMTVKVEFIFLTRHLCAPCWWLCLGLACLCLYFSSSCYSLTLLCLYHMILHVYSLFLGNCYAILTLPVLLQTSDIQAIRSWHKCWLYPRFNMIFAVAFCELDIKERTSVVTTVYPGMSPCRFCHCKFHFLGFRKL